MTQFERIIFAAKLILLSALFAAAVTYTALHAFAAEVDRPIRVKIIQCGRMADIQETVQSIPECAVFLPEVEPAGTGETDTRLCEIVNGQPMCVEVVE